MEIDFWGKINSRVFIIEAKRSDFDWVFLQNTEKSKDVHLLCKNQQHVYAVNRALSKVDCVSKQVVEVLEENSAPTLCKNKRGTKTSRLPIRSSREEYLRNYAR